MGKIIGNPTVTPMAIPDWNQTDPTKADYIKNKPMVIKEVSVNEIDNLHFNHPDFIEDGIYLVTDDSILPEYGRSQYFIITATDTNRPKTKEYDETHLGCTIQYKLSYDGSFQKRKISPELNETGDYVYNWTRWETIGSGGGGGGGSDSRIGNLDDLTTYNKDTIVAAINEIDADCDSRQREMIELISTIYRYGDTLGNPADLSTQDKSSVVNAINEVNSGLYVTKHYAVEATGLSMSALENIPAYTNLTLTVSGSGLDLEGYAMIISYENENVGSLDSEDMIYGDGTYKITTPCDTSGVWISISEGSPTTNLKLEWEIATSVKEHMSNIENQVVDIWSHVNAQADTIGEMTKPPETIVYTTLERNTAYELANLEWLTLTFPSKASIGDVIYVSFLSLDTPTNLTVDTSNVIGFDLVPEANTVYEIYAKYDGALQMWLVKYSECSLEGGI